MNQRTLVLVGVLVALGIVSIVVWKNSGGEETSEVFDSALAEYTCQSCSQAFTMTGAESVAALKSETGIVCPHCGAPLDRVAVLSGREFGATDDSDESSDDMGDDGRPPRATGGTLTKVRN